ncbi:MAG: poly-beta-1,6 N-acetyl-D-glucosamine export porin PgaA [Nitrospiria bacterium]
MNIQLISVLSVVFFFFAPVSLSAQTDFIDAQHKKAVELARTGETEKSLTLFKQLLSEKPDHQKLLSDYLLVLSWAEQCVEVIKIYEKSLKTPSAYVLNAAAKCYRNLKKFDQAILTYEAALIQTPDDREARLGLAYAFADAGVEKKALPLLESLIASDQTDLKPHFAKAYLYERQGLYLKAIREYEDILKKNPDHTQAWRLKIKNLSTLGAHQLALESALNRQRPVDHSLETRLRLNRAAQALRWGKHIDVLTLQKRLKETDLAMEILSNVLKKDPRNIRARGDRVIALFDRFKIIDGVSAYERLKKEGVPLAEAIELTAAAAYLSLNHPEEAIAIYRKILKKRPNDFKVRLNLFYGILILNQLEEAEGILRKLRVEEAAPTVKKQGVLEPNWRKVELESAAIWLWAHRDQLSHAEEGFRTLLDNAPMNSSLHSGLAHIYLWRGWPRKALREFEQILHYDPRYVGVRVGYATTLMEMRQYEKAHTEIAKLVKEAAFDRHVQQLQKEWQVHNQNELWVFSDYKREERGSRAWYAELSLNSRPFFSTLRMTADVIRQEASADNDQFNYSRLNAGVSYEGGQGLTFRQKISFDIESSGGIGAITNIAYQIDDYWLLDAKYDSFSLDVPLRASVIGVTAKSFELGLLYRVDERKEVHFGVNQIRLSDGNQRNRYSLRTRYKLIPGPTYTHFLQFNLTSSRNSLAGRVYFNPQDDLAYAIRTIHQWRHKNIRPGKEFRQTLSGTVGGYDQAGFSLGLTGQVQYSHEWDFAVGETLAYHVAYNRQIFDGKAEHSPAFNIRLIHHF